MTQWGLDTLFNPAKQHMDEEKRRLQSTREEIGDASGGRRIDLDSGKVRIPRPSAKADAASRRAASADEAPTADGSPTSDDAPATDEAPAPGVTDVAEARADDEASAQ